MSIRLLNVLTLFITIIGGLNWGLIGLFDFDVIGAIFGDDFADDPATLVTRIVYVIIGLAALWQLFRLFRRLTPRV